MRHVSKKILKKKFFSPYASIRNCMYKKKNLDWLETVCVYMCGGRRSQTPSHHSVTTFSKARLTKMSLNWGRNSNMLPCGWYPMLYSPQVTLLTLAATCVSSKRLDFGEKMKKKKKSSTFIFAGDLLRAIFNIKI